MIRLTTSEAHNGHTGSTGAVWGFFARAITVDNSWRGTMPGDIMSCLSKTRRGANSRKPNNRRNRIDVAQDHLGADERLAEAVRLRRQGCSYTEIASRLGVARSTAFGYIQSHWHEVCETARDDLAALREIELARLERLHKKWSEIAFAGELLVMVDRPGGHPVPVCRLDALQEQLRASEMLVKLSERRARILGLDAKARAQPEEAASGWVSLREILPLLPAVVSV